MSSGNRIVVGLTGPFGAGCSWIADDLRDRYKFRRYFLTDAMRELAPKFFVDDLDEEKLYSPKHRSYQQDVGDEIRRKDF